MIKEFVKKYEKNSIIISILMIIMSLFLIFEPIKALKTLVIIFGIIITISGIVSLISYFRLEKDLKIISFGLVEGLLEMIAGILILCNTEVMTTFIPIMVGIWIIMKNLIRFQLSINLKQIPNSGWIWLLLASILAIILGVMIIINPFSFTLAITLVAGIILFITEFFNLIEGIYMLIKLK